jgi:hypothetical protein
MSAFDHIAELRNQLGLLRIAHDHKATLLASCEIALGARNETITALQAENAKLRKVVEDLVALINDSHGVAGLHLNGDAAPWDELLAGGRFEDWLRSLSDAGYEL